MEHGYVLAILGMGGRSLRPLRRNLPDTRRAHWPGLADRTVHHFHSAGIVVGYAESYALGLGTAVRTLNTEVTEIWGRVASIFGYCNGIFKIWAIRAIYNAMFALWLCEDSGLEVECEPQEIEHGGHGGRGGKMWKQAPGGQSHILS